MQTLYFLVNSVLSFLVYAFLLRVLLQVVRADFRNPLAQAVVALTNWLVLPLRKVLPPAGRFDTALNNMPHGLCMLDPQRRLVVANKRLSEILQLGEVRRGASLRAALGGAVTCGTLNGSTLERLLSDLDSRLSGKSHGELAVGTVQSPVMAWKRVPPCSSVPWL